MATGSGQFIVFRFPLISVPVLWSLSAHNAMNHSCHEPLSERSLFARDDDGNSSSSPSSSGAGCLEQKKKKR